MGNSIKIGRVLYEGKTYNALKEHESIQLASGESIFEYEVIDIVVQEEEIVWLPPVHPAQLVCIGLNYKKHAEEVNKPLPKEPMLFLVSPSAIVSTQKGVYLKNSSHRNEHEGELAIVIGKTAENVSIEEAKNYIFGYTIANDISDRDIQKKDIQFSRAKSFPTYKPLGPYVVTNIDGDNLKIEVMVNGEVRQSSSTSDMIFKVAELVSFVSHSFKLNQGDVIITGTPEGVSPLYHNDEVKVVIENIGELSNKIIGG